VSPEVPSAAITPGRGLISASHKLKYVRLTLACQGTGRRIGHHFVAYALDWIASRAWSFEKFDQNIVTLESYRWSRTILIERGRIIRQTIAVCCTVGKPHNITNQTNQSGSARRALRIEDPYRERYTLPLRASRAVRLPRMMTGRASQHDASLVNPRPAGVSADRARA
jgi:hypothetical protein